MAPKGPNDWLSQDQLAPIRVQFFQECVEHLAELESGLTGLDHGDLDPETINTVFRAAHSIKGGAGIFGLDALVRFAHDMETVLAALRSGQIQPDGPALKALLRAADVLSDLVGAARDGSAVDPGRITAATGELAGLLGDPGGNAGVDEDDLDLDIDFTPVAIDLDEIGPAEAPRTHWRLAFRPLAELYASANDPLMLFGELARLGDLSVRLDETATPFLQDLNPADPHLSWTLDLHTASDETAIREVFEFVERDCELQITARPPAPAAPEAATPPPPPEPSPLAARASLAAAPPPTTPTIAPPAQAPTIRVDLERVDRLIDLVSELVIGEATLAERASALSGTASAQLFVAVDDLRRLTRDIQESVMAIRAQPVKSLFQRMSRLVREVEAQTGKQVRLITEGDETEVDRAVIERLTDPLTHMIRNSIDHGLESARGRVEAGKPVQGTVRLSASHRAGRIVIEVADDGAGIDRERVRAIAAERGLINTADNLGDDEIDNLIFEPGFSTMEQASDLSGRGVGMDVVRRSVQALGGRISLSSRAGEGTTFSLSLPLTLAVMDGMLVNVSGQCLVIPLTALLESVKPEPADVRRLGAHAEVIAIRGLHVPLIDLGAALNYRQRPASAGQGVALLVEDDAGERIALIVDEIVEQRQVVIKSLETNYRALRGVAAATILGDGRVALIVDVNAIIAAQKVRRPSPDRQVAHA